MEDICYTGIGAKKSGNHTRKEFIKVMNKTFKKKCSLYTKSIQCKPCKKLIQMTNMETIKSINAALQKKTYKMSKKTEKKIINQQKKCNLCKNKNTKPCNLDEYLAFSGAFIGQCENELKEKTP